MSKPVTFIFLVFNPTNRKQPFQTASASSPFLSRQPRHFLKESSLPSKFSYIPLEFLFQGKLVIGNPCSGLNIDLLYVARSIQQVRSLCQGKNTISNSKEASVKSTREFIGIVMIGKRSNHRCERYRHATGKS